MQKKAQQQNIPFLCPTCGFSEKQKKEVGAVDKKYFVADVLALSGNLCWPSSSIIIKNPVRQRAEMLALVAERWTTALKAVGSSTTDRRAFVDSLLKSDEN